MPWFNVDDGFANSKPVLRIPRRYRCAAVGLWTLAGSWSAKELTDGFIPDHAIEEFASSVAMAEQLVKAGLWKRADGGWQFEGWAKWQKTREQVYAYRAAEAERKRKARGAKGKPGVTPPMEDVSGDPDRFLIDSSTSRAGGPGTAQPIPTGGRSAGQGMVSHPDSARTRSGVPLGLRAESGIPIPEPSPEPSPLPVETSSGGVTSVDARGPRPRCNRHPNENALTSCAACARRREWDEADEEQRKADELAARRHIREAIDACPLCDQYGRREVGPNRLAKCDHKETRHA